MSLNPDEQVTSTSNATSEQVVERVEGGGNRIESLPQEVLVSIWIRTNDPGPFSMSSKYLHTFGKDAFVRSKYFLFKYPKYEVIFRAIGHSKLFDKKLLKLLIRGGAPLSRALCQHLLVVFANRTHRGWGSNLSFDGFTAVMDETKRLYGGRFSVKGPTDDELFRKWLSPSNTDFTLISKLFKDFSFMPLPIFNNNGGGGNTASATLKAIQKDPRVLSLASKNGFVNLTEGFIDSVIRLTFTKPGSNPQKVVEDIKQLMKDERFYVSKTVASQIIMTQYDPTPLNPSTPTPYEALILLQPVLRFDLAELAFEVVTSHIENWFDDKIMAFVDKLTLDFPSMPNPFNHYHQLLSSFIKAEKQLPPDYGLVDVQDEDRLAQIHSMIGNIEVTNSHIYAIFFSNLIGSTLCVSYARKYVEGFDEQAFLLKLLEKSGILTRPYKGRQLKELLQRSDQAGLGFDSLLEKTIISKAIDIQKIPLGSVVRRHGFRRGLGPSILASEWSFGSVTLPRRNHQTLAYLPPGYVELWKTSPGASGSLEPSNFEIQKSPQTLKNEDAPELYRKKIRTADFKKDSFISIFDASSRDLSQSYGHHRARSYQGSNYLRVEDNSGCDDVWGKVKEKSMSNASAVLEYFGPSNLTVVPIMFEHIVINNNSREMEKYLKAGVPVTLFHLQMSARFGDEISPHLLQSIQEGALFVRSKNRRETNDEDDDKLLKARASLTAQEKREMAGSSTVDGGDRGVFVSPTLLRFLESEESDGLVYTVEDGLAPPVNTNRTEAQKKASLSKWLDHLSAISRLEKRKLEVRKVSSDAPKTEKTPFHLELEKAVLPSMKKVLSGQLSIAPEDASEHFYDSDFW